MLLSAVVVPGSLNQYRVIEKLGEGGMGDVYLARDEKLDRTVALKIPSKEIASDSERLGRFLQEAKAASAVKHPNVAHIYEIGESGGIPFIAMEHVEGETLSERTLEVSRLLDVAIQVADALDEAHAKGIVHRDLKPSNLMLTARDQVKILDFGLAKFLTRPVEDGSDVPTQAKTRDGVVMGTVSYMSPEQALAREVDARSDLFSLGVVLYQLAAGRLPFSGSSATETIDRIAHAQPEALARFNYDVPAELERIIRKCLEKSPSSRYQSARELLVDLKNLKRDRESGAFVSSPPRRRGRRILAAVGALLLAGAAMYWMRDAGGAAVHSLAVLPFENASGDPDADYLGDGISETLTVRLAQFPGIKVISNGSVFRYKGRVVEPQEVRRDLAVDAVVRGRISQRGSSLTVTTELVDTRDLSLLWGEQYVREPNDILAVQDEIVSELSRSLRVRLVGDVPSRDPASAEAYQAYLKGRFHWNKRSEAGLRQSIEYFQQAVRLDPGYALAYVGLADAYGSLGYFFAPPGEFFPKARAAATRALEIEDLAEAHASLGFVHMIHDWDWDGAEASFRRSIELDPSYSNARMWYAGILAIRRDHEAALSQIDRAVELDPLSLTVNGNLGWHLTWAGRYRESIEHLRNAITLDPAFGPMYNRLGDALLEAGRADEAIDVYEQGLRYTRSFDMLSSLATAYAVAGDKERLQELLATLQVESRDRYLSPLTFAAAHAALGDRDQARLWLERAFEERVGSIPLLGGLPARTLFADEPRFTELLRGIGLEPLPVGLSAR